MNIKSEEVTYELFEEILQLLKDHKDEISSLGERLNPNILGYTKMYHQDFYRIIVARDDDNKIIGYISYIIYEHPHHRGTRVAHQDMVYLVKSSRKGFNALSLIKKSEEIIKESNIKYIIQHSSLKNDISKLFERLKYKECDRVFLKEV